jgi:nucleoid-associated protein YgaU
VRIRTSLGSIAKKVNKSEKSVYDFLRKLSQKNKTVLRKVSAYRVRKGESLRVIAGYDFIYADREKWRLIYKANKDKIRNPDILTPGLILRIPREE